MTGTDGTTTYAYDLRDRLTEACFAASCPGANDPFIRWTYDAVGNRLTEARPAGTTSYGYNNGDQLVSQSGPGGSVSYSYDADGNQTGAGSRTFGYDLANRLASTASGGSTTSYSYDGSGNRLQATAGSQTTSYLWDEANPLPELALERDGSGSPLRRYEYGSSRISVTAGAGQTYYFHADGLGSVANVTSASGQTEWTYGYEPYGAARVETKNDPAAPENPMRFAGEQLDSDSGLYYLRARTYDPASGRFLARDPLSQLATSPASSSYLYAADSPTVYTDPSGLGPVRPRLDVLSPSPDLSWSEDCTPPRELYGGPDLLWPAWAWGWRTTCERIKAHQKKEQKCLASDKWIIGLGLLGIGASATGLGIYMISMPSEELAVGASFLDYAEAFHFKWVGSLNLLTGLGTGGGGWWCLAQ